MKKTKSKKLNSFYTVTVSDVILVLFILVTTAGAVISRDSEKNTSQFYTPEALVFHNGRTIKNFKLNKKQEIELLDGRMILETDGKRLRVKKSDCPHQTCLHIGWIHYPGETIACIPYDTLIEIKQSDSPVVDAVIY